MIFLIRSYIRVNMDNTHFQKRVRDLANSDEFNVDLFNQIKEKHEKLLKEDQDYLQTEEYLFLMELYAEVPDLQSRAYFRDQVINTPVSSWKKSFWTKMKRLFLK